jgi:hypothetical protein
VIWRCRETDSLKVGLNWDWFRGGPILVLYWRGILNCYAVRLRIRRPNHGKRVLFSAWKACLKCDPRIGYCCWRHTRTEAQRLRNMLAEKYR